MIDEKDYWDKSHLQFFDGKVKYDNWLGNYLTIILNSKKKVMDLGCGTGNNSLYLLEKGKNVIACDFSSEALKIVEEKLKKVKTVNFDINNKFPFKNNSFDLIIADLCLHYFSEEDTKKILLEINRVLSKGGYLLLRVNSINDFNSIQGIEIDKHYYIVDGIKKRFFNKDDLIFFFKDWKIIDMVEENMTRYSKDKIVWRMALKKTD